MTRGVEYSEDVAVQICERLAAIGSLHKVCREPGMPHTSTVYAWLHREPSFAWMYQAARDQYADLRFDELEQLMNEAPAKDERGRIDHGWVLRQKLRIETVKWELARLAPKKYSERVELTGAEGQPLVPPSEELTPERRLEGARRMAFALARADEVLKQKAPAPAPLQLVHEIKRQAPEPEREPPGAPPPPRDIDPYGVGDLWQEAPPPTPHRPVGVVYDAEDDGGSSKEQGTPRGWRSRR